MSNVFGFLQAEWPEVYEAANKAAEAAFPEPRTACFYARRALELAVMWAYRHDRSLSPPYRDDLSALIHAPSFKNAAGDAVFLKARLIKSLGNDAVHQRRPIPSADAVTAVRELFHVAYWFAHTYARGAPPAPSLTFKPDDLPRSNVVPAQTAAQMQQLEANLRDRDERLEAQAAANAQLIADLERARAEVAEAKKAAATRVDTHDYDEAKTRDAFIDKLLKDAGWPLDNARDREFPVTGMPNNEGAGFVDYVLWGDDGKPLAVVEAKRTRRSSQQGQQQAKLYADCLEAEFGQRPIIFLTNGQDHFIWDDALYPMRPVQGFYKKAELDLAIQRRTIRKKLSRAGTEPGIAERYYQTRAIRRVAEAFERDNERKALLVMATGAGKTRTVIALCDLLMRCNWVKRVLFLADRVALVNQAINAFKKHLPDSAPVNLVTEKETDGRVFGSTYQTMMGLIDEPEDGTAHRRFGVGHFDLVIVDEAHRSVYQKYSAIFRYFDSLLVGLTATPKDEVDRDTYSLFNLEKGVPTDAYNLDEAIKDGFLVPPKAVALPLKFQRGGIVYDDLPEEDKQRWDELEWEEEDGPQDKVEPEAVNKWFFNADTVDKVLMHLMEKGQKVAGGDRLGKTIIFAKNQHHADFIQERFDANYPSLKGQFARVITHSVEYAGSLIDSFSLKDKPPHIAISVEMLDTGIDVPEVVNLVFFKVVRSKSKFWQMVGRGTRLCADLFAPGENKAFFFIFDCCGNLEFFSQNLETTGGAVKPSLRKRLFQRRLDLVGELDRRHVPRPPPLISDAGPSTWSGPKSDIEVRDELAHQLREEVAAMNVDNFLVRPKRFLVERYRQPEAWTKLSDEGRASLAHELAGLPSETETEPEETKRFDLLMFNLELALLRKKPDFKRLRKQVELLAALLEEKKAIPMVNAQMSLILDVQTDEWWQDVTLPMLESMRRRLRELVKLIEKQSRKPLYADFDDELGSPVEVALPAFAAATDFERFRAKARSFLREHQDHVTVAKLRMNRPLTTSDLDELERILVENGVGGKEEIQHAKSVAESLGLFVRSLIGLDREASKEALATFLVGKTLSANQIEFVNLVVDHLTERGVVEPGALYESPFTDLTPHGPDAIFTEAQMEELMVVLEGVKATAVAR